MALIRMSRWGRPGGSALLRSARRPPRRRGWSEHARAGASATTGAISPRPNDCCGSPWARSSGWARTAPIRLVSCWTWPISSSTCRNSPRPRPSPGGSRSTRPRTGATPSRSGRASTRSGWCIASRAGMPSPSRSTACLAIVEASPKADTDDLAGALQNLGTLLIDMEEDDEAEKIHRRGARAVGEGIRSRRRSRGEDPEQPGDPLPPQGPARRLRTRLPPVVGHPGEIARARAPARRHEPAQPGDAPQGHGPVRRRRVRGLAIVEPARALSGKSRPGDRPQPEEPGQHPAGTGPVRRGEHTPGAVAGDPGEAAGARSSRRHGLPGDDRRHRQRVGAFCGGRAAGETGHGEPSQEGGR